MRGITASDTTPTWSVRRPRRSWCAPVPRPRSARSRPRPLPPPRLTVPISSPTQIFLVQSMKVEHVWTGLHHAGDGAPFVWADGTPSL